NNSTRFLNGPAAIAEPSASIHGSVFRDSPKRNGADALKRGAGSGQLTSLWIPCGPGLLHHKIISMRSGHSGKSSNHSRRHRVESEAENDIHRDQKYAFHPVGFSVDGNQIKNTD